MLLSGGKLVGLASKKLVSWLNSIATVWRGSGADWPAVPRRLVKELGNNLEIIGLAERNINYNKVIIIVMNRRK